VYSFGSYTWNGRAYARIEKGKIREFNGG